MNNTSCNQNPYSPAAVVECRRPKEEAILHTFLCLPSPGSSSPVFGTSRHALTSVECGKWMTVLKISPTAQGPRHWSEWVYLGAEQGRTEQKLTVSTRSAPLKENWTETEQPHTDATRVSLLHIPIVHRNLLLLSLHSTVNTAEGLTFLFKFQVRLRHRIDKCVHKMSPFMSRPFVNVVWEKRRLLVLLPYF